MYNILIEDGLSLKQQRGVGQYTMRLTEVLSKSFQVDVKRKKFLENIKNNIIRRLLYGLWLNTVFVFNMILKRNVTVCFFTATMTPIIRVPNVKYVSFIHDIRSVVHPELSTKIQNIHANFANWTAINFSDVIVTVSDTVKNEIKNFYKIKDEKIKIVNNTSSIQNIVYDETEKILNQFNLTSKKYLFFIGGLDKNKNVQLIINAFEKISKKYTDLKLVIGGNSGNAELFYDNSNIICTGFISNEDIKVLYKNALIYLFPSIYEGFGIPIIDAQIMQVPVICSDIPVFHEVAGKGAVFCNLLEYDFIEAIEKIYSDLDFRNKLIMYGQKNTERYSLQKIEKSIIEVLD